jgi:hypothetical protein
VSRSLPGRFSSLLVSILLLLLLRPFLEGFVVARLLLTALFTAALISALYSVSRPAWAFKVGLALIVPAIAWAWIRHVIASPVLELSGYPILLLAFGFTAVVTVLHTLQAKRVTVEQISGALSAYLLFGLVWGLAYFLLESAAPGSLSFGTASDEARFGASIYYSFVTLTTLGYGDILPLSDRARSLAFLEAVIGQIYLAVLVAKLVGMYASGSASANDDAG